MSINGMFEQFPKHSTEKHTHAHTYCQKCGKNELKINLKRRTFFFIPDFGRLVDPLFSGIEWIWIVRVFVRVWHGK